MKITAGVLLLIPLAGGSLLAQDVAIKTLLSRDLAGSPGKELTMITVDYRPGAVDPVHTHNAHAMVYVLEGSVVMQVEGRAPVTLVPGQTFYEQPGDVHTVARNASNTAPAKFVVFRQRQGRADSDSQEVSRPHSAHTTKFR